MLTEEAIKRIQETYDTKPEFLSAEDGRTWLVMKHGLKYSEVFPLLPETLKTSTLTGLCEMSKDDPKLKVYVMSHNEVCLMTDLDDWKLREYPLVAKINPKRFEYGRYFNLADMTIFIMEHFQEGESMRNLLHFISNVKSEQVHQDQDDGVKQKVTIKNSITTVAQATVPNPVSLVPYLTFPEVDFVSRKYIFRLKDNDGLISGALFETGSETWKLSCIDNIVNYIKKHAAKGVKIIY